MKNNLANKTYALLKKKFDDLLEEQNRHHDGSDGAGSLYAGDLYVDKKWWEYMGKMGCVPYDSLNVSDNPFKHPDGFVVVLNPQSIWKRSIAVPEEVAIKAVVLGGFP